MLNDRNLQIAADGSFEIVVSEREHAGNWMKLEDDAVALVTRYCLSERPRVVKQGGVG